MTNKIKSIPLNELVPHPDNSNTMSKANFAKLVRNIERTGRYEPLLVRPHPTRKGFYQIINGHHRRQALEKLGHKTASAIVWDIDDQETRLLLATLNRLGGRDVLEKKLALLRRLNARLTTGELAKLLPTTAKQIERLINLKLPSAPPAPQAESFLAPLVFFVTAAQKEIIEKAMLLAQKDRSEKTTAARNAAALTIIAQHFSGDRG
jgi:ParB/RepB/Spo0J family partition protein